MSTVAISPNLHGKNRDLPWENRPSSHLVMIVEIPVLKFLIGIANQLLLVLGRLSLIELDTIVYWLSYSVA